MIDRNLECLITILRDHGRKLSTQQILEAVKQYPELCKGCSSGTEIIAAGLILKDQGKIERKVTKGGFLWILL